MPIMPPLDTTKSLRPVLVRMDWFVDLGLDVRGNYRVRVIRLSDQFVFLSKKDAFDAHDLLELHQKTLVDLLSGKTPVTHPEAWLRDGRAEHDVAERVRETVQGRHVDKPTEDDGWGEREQRIDRMR